MTDTMMMMVVVVVMFCINQMYEALPKISGI
jgi:hypothetical protein